jgi:hypothetical protein
MARHSAYNKEKVPTACGASMLPFRTACKGPVNTGKVSQSTPPQTSMHVSTHKQIAYLAVFDVYGIIEVHKSSCAHIHKGSVGAHKHSGRGRHN